MEAVRERMEGSPGGGMEGSPGERRGMEGSPGSEITSPRPGCPRGAGAGLLLARLGMEMDVATHGRVLFSTEDCSNSAKCSNIGQRGAFLSFPHHARY